MSRHENFLKTATFTILHTGDVSPQSKTKEVDRPKGEARKLPQVQQPGLRTESRAPGEVSSGRGNAEMPTV